MQRTSRTAQVGAAFFLCLGLAVVPVSLRVAGVSMTLSPRLAAAIDVWGEIADAFRGGYQQATQSELAAVKNPEDEHTNEAAETVCRAASSCVNDAVVPANTPPAVSVAHAKDAVPARPRCAKAARRQSIDHTLAREGMAEIAIHSPAIEAAFKDHATSILGTINVEATQKEWMNVVQKSLRFRDRESKMRMRSLGIPQNLKVLIQLKTPAASKQPAECKVRAAMAAAKRFESERAGLLREHSINLDTGEF